MKKHQGYTTARNKGAECTECGEWISTGDECVLLQSCTVDDNGSAKPTAKSFHGVLCMGCFKDL